MIARIRLCHPLWLALLLVSGPAAPAETGAARKGPPLDQPPPPVHARDQFGREQTLATLAGPNGLVLLFFRSADW
jgi:hypothetical protein